MSAVTFRKKSTSDEKRKKNDRKRLSFSYSLFLFLLIFLYSQIIYNLSTHNCQLFSNFNQGLSDFVDFGFCVALLIGNWKLSPETSNLQVPLMHAKLWIVYAYVFGVFSGSLDGQLSQNFHQWQVNVLHFSITFKNRESVADSNNF